MRRTWRPIAFASILLLPACSLGDRQDRADRVTAAAVRTVTDLGPLSGTIAAAVTFEVDADAGDGISVSVGGPPGAPGQEAQLPTEVPAFPAEVRFYLDPEADRALLGPVDGGAFPRVHFTDTLIALHLPDSEETARPWIAVSLEDLDDGSGSIEDDTFDNPGIAGGVLSVLDPRLLLDLATGPLAGSIEPGVPDQVDGVATTRYEANFDLPRALEEERDDAYDDDRLEVIEMVLDLVNIERDVNPGTVWVDEDGLLRRFDISLRIEADSLLRFAVDLSLTVEPTDVEDADFALPTRDEVVRVDSLLPIAKAAAAAVAPDVLGGLVSG